ncbi:unnamed protein product, partial [Darwinula stevensoni]
PVQLVVEPGYGTDKTLQKLADAGVTVSPRYFKLLQRLTGRTTLKAGDYKITDQMSPMSLLEKISDGKVDPTQITVIEGWTFQRLRDALAKNPILIHDTKDLSQEQILKLVGSTHTHAEGLFYPATYDFITGDKESEILQRAYDKMQKELQVVWDNRDKTTSYKNPYELLIMASIIEKEAGTHEDRALISSVFNNRLQKGMKLQTDPSVIYGIKNYDGNIRKRDLLTDTPYNTYTRMGLPPTPIALPGKAALQAAALPDKTHYLYFVARGDKSSAFAQTLAEHNANVRKYQQNPNQPLTRLHEETMKPRGKMISFEGIDGAGKSTFMAWFVNELEHRLAKQHRSLIQTREPGGTPVGENIRNLLLNQSMLPTTEALLMFAARQELFSRVILPALTRGDWVVSDRFVDASFAYQGGGRGLTNHKLEQPNDWVLGDFHPDYTIIF